MKRGKYTLRTLAAFFTVVLISLCYLERAESADLAHQFENPTLLSDMENSIYLSLSSFTWAEYDVNGAELLTESGPHVVIGAKTRAALTEALTVQLKGELFGGNVDYDGQDIQTKMPVVSDANYSGFTGEVDVGLKVIASQRSALEPFAAIGLRWWKREVEDVSFIAGFLEKWSTVYTRLGIRGDHAYAEDFRIFAEGGIKSPLSIKNKVDLTDRGLSDVTLKPGNKPSYFAEVGVKRKTMMASFYYEGMRFSRSNAKPIPGDLIWQPESEADLFGLRLGVVF